MKIKDSMIGGILLVAGTCVGAGMLALPIVTSLAGFYPSIFLMLIVWLFMMTTAFLFLEATLQMKKEANIISMVQATLGNTAAVISWIVYLFLLYSLITAYLAGSGSLLEDSIESIIQSCIPRWFVFVPFVIIFGSFIYLGTRSIDYLNRLLIIGFVLGFVLLVMFIPPYIQLSSLKYNNWKGILIAISIVITSFGFHIIIPSLVSYMHGNIKKLKRTIFIGSIIPLFIYLLWEFLVLGTIPIHGKDGLLSLWHTGGQIVRPFKALINNNLLISGARLFSFFAIVTSILGVSLSLSDFLADFFFVAFGIKTKGTRAGKIFLSGMTFIPPLIFAMLYSRAFVVALSYAGAFGVVILLGILPTLMVWNGRYRKKMQTPLR